MVQDPLQDTDIRGPRCEQGRSACKKPIRTGVLESGKWPVACSPSPPGNAHVQESRPPAARAAEQVSLKPSVTWTLSLVLRFLMLA